MPKEVKEAYDKMHDYFRKVRSFEEFCNFLREQKVRKIYLIHESYRERKTRRFSERLRKEGFMPFVASDYRKGGALYVNEAITICDISLVVAFDPETVRKAKELNVPFIDLGDV